MSLNLNSKSPTVHYNEISHLFNPCFSTDSSVVDLIERLRQAENGKAILKQMHNSTAELQVGMVPVGYA